MFTLRKFCTCQIAQFFIIPLASSSIYLSCPATQQIRKSAFSHALSRPVCVTPYSFSTATKYNQKMAKFEDHSNLTWKLTVKDIEDATEDIMKNTKAVFDFVGSLKSVTYKTVIQKLADDACVSNSRINNVDFVQHVFGDKTLRDASVAASKKLSEFGVEMSMRQDVFDQLVAYEKQDEVKDLKPEAKRFLERLIKVGKRNGLHLAKDKQDEIKEIKKRKSELSIDFNNNLGEDTTFLEFSEKDLAGLPEDFIKNLEKCPSGKLKLTLQYPHYFPVVKKAENPETRKRMYDAFNSRCIKENTGILEELVELRHKQAKILDFPTHAAYILDMRMSKTPGAVSTFLTDLAKKLKPLRDAEVASFLKYKKKECDRLNIAFDGKIHMYDMRYYMNIVEEEEYVVDHDILKDYFPMDVVTKGLLNIYQELLGLIFTEIKDAKVWHEDVRQFSVQDTDTKDLLGYFYLDLFPREGKFSHAAVFSLQPSCINPKGKRQAAVAAMVANFPKATDDHPSLLTHEDVETFFHEFGHVMHSLCSKAEFEEFAGSSVERDFVEAPSQMLENWVWEIEPLRRMSAHYKDGRPIPDDLLTALINSRTANAGVFNTRQILLSTFDQNIHTSAKADTASVFATLCAELMGMGLSPGINMAASFAHLADGYDAQYYGYLWSEVFSADMFRSKFKKEGIMNPKVGREYRKHILETGGSLDAADMLRNFLGRDPQQEAFLVSKGLKG